MTTYHRCPRCKKMWYFVPGRQYRKSPCCGKEFV